MIALATRNLWRNQRRSLTTLLAMILGTVAILLFGGYCTTVFYGLETGFVGSSGHLQLQRRDFFRFGSGDIQNYSIKNYKQIIDDIEADPALQKLVSVTTPTLQLGGIAGNFDAGLSRLVMAQGVDVEGQNAMRQWNDYQQEMQPELISISTSKLNQVEIGVGIARGLQLCQPLQVSDCEQKSIAPTSKGASLPADIANLMPQTAPPDAGQARLELLVAGQGGAPNVAGLHAVKAVSTGSRELDDVFLVMHLQQAQQLVFGNDEPGVTAIQIQLHHTADLSTAQARLNELISSRWQQQPLEVLDFTEINPSFGQITGMFSAIFGFITILICAIVLFTVSNTMSMAVMERTVEIGTLRTMGLRRSGIRWLFLTEGCLLGLLGAMLGTSLSLIVAALINAAGLSWLPPGSSEAVPLTIRLQSEYGLMLSISLILLLVASCSAWWPARRAARLNIVEALRYV